MPRDAPIRVNLGNFGKLGNLGNVQCLWQNLPAGSPSTRTRQPAVQAALNDRHSQVQR